MDKRTVLRLVLLSGLAIGTLNGCLPFSLRWGFPRQAAQIQAQQAGQQVRVSGAVVQQAPFVQGGAYLVADRTGQVWVLTDEALPDLETRVTVYGIIRSEELVWDATPPTTEQAAYLQELERR
ncbi:MAG: hypothetical protein ACPGVO_05255 [Spirulinaceae cyanobacterium]